MAASMLGAVYSEQAQCQDCYRCVRECPVKAIRVTEGHATVMPERCIACGSCIAACPAGAKRVRDDLEAVEALLQGDAPVWVSLAPSYASEFEDLEPRRLVAALRRLGFRGVSETALGAQEVSARIAQELDATAGQVLLSTACPVVVDLVEKYLPERTALFTRVASPLLAHARLLRARLGEGIRVVFIGPCIGKKAEALAHPGEIDAALTFENLREWLEREGLDPAALEPDEDDRFALGQAAEGARYPIEGGMVDATRLSLRSGHTRFMAVSGVRQIQRALRELPEPDGSNLFLELLACEGGCVCGPKALRHAPVTARMKVLDRVRDAEGAYPRQPTVAVEDAFASAPQPEEPCDVTKLEHVLRRIGKRSPEDELNCGACGYETCRDLARATLDGRAERRMCVSYMRNLAEKKANALIRTLPFGVVLAGETLEIIECNEEFAHLMGEDAELVYRSLPGLGGAHLEKFLPDTKRFQEVLEGGPEIIRENLQSGGRTLSMSVFTVEPHRVIAMLLLDVTETERRREQVIGKAQQVIQNMLANVQDIAFSLGRNAAKSEGILNSIIAEFSEQEGHGQDDGD